MTEAPPSRIGSGRTGRFVSVAPQKLLYPVETGFKRSMCAFLSGMCCSYITEIPLDLSSIRNNYRRNHPDG